MNQTTPIDIDELLQDSYLLVVQLHQGTAVEEGQNLWQNCKSQVEDLEQALRQKQMSQRAIEHIRYAQCALLDETVLGRGQDDGYSAWHAKPLQAHFFQTLQAGEELYVRMRDVLREPAPDIAVLTCFQRVLMLGFRGRYQEDNSPERMELLKTLSSQVPPLRLTQSLHPVMEAERTKHLRWRHSRFVHLLIASCVLAGVWWGAHLGLMKTLMALLPHQS